MKTRFELKEMVKALSPQECYDLIGEIAGQHKVVVYGNWYSKNEIEEMVNAADPSYIRDLKLEGVLEAEADDYSFDDLYDGLCEHTQECYGGPDEDFRTYILSDYMDEYKDFIS